VTDTQQQPAAGWWLASDGNWYPPETAPAPRPAPTEAETASAQAGEWMIREDGKNGSVRLEPKALVRTFRKRLGKDDVLTIPLRSISSVHHDRRSLGTDIVTVTAGHTPHRWKVRDAESFVATLNAAIYS
jgi:hypothetical protein